MHTRIRNFEIPIRHFSAVKHIMSQHWHHTTANRQHCTGHFAERETFAKDSKPSKSYVNDPLNKSIAESPCALQRATISTDVHNNGKHIVSA